MESPTQKSEKRREFSEVADFFRLTKNMEDVLRSLRNNEDKAKSSAVFHLLKAYINNIVGNPSNAKFRRIRISNPKFYSIIWCNEDARSFLLLAGFEETEDFLALPDGIDLDGAKIILDGIALDDVPVSSAKTCPASQPAQSSSSKLLKLRQDGSMFDEVVNPDLTLLSYMKEMGFDVKVAEKALIITKNKGVQPAMDWINSNPTEVNEIRMAKFKKANETTEVPMGTIDGNQHVQPVQSTIEAMAAPVSRFQTTIDERHRFQEKLRLEAIEAARVEKVQQKRQKEYLLKNLEVEKKERKEKGEQIKHMRMSDNVATTSGVEKTDQSTTEQGESDIISLKLRLPGGQVSGLKVQPQSLLRSIYEHISRISDLKEEEFTVMTVSPQRRLTEKEKNLEELGIKSQETLIVQRADQIGSLTQGHGAICQVLEIETAEQWEVILRENNDKLIVVEFFVIWSADCKRSVQEFDALNAEYGINKQALFVRVNTDLLPALKSGYNIAVLPTYKFIWNGETVCDIHGVDKEKLQKVIVENLRGPAAEKVADTASEDYFDPR